MYACMHALRAPSLSNSHHHHHTLIIIKGARLINTLEDRYLIVTTHLVDITYLFCSFVYPSYLACQL